jgi:WD40 repeat protein
MFGLLALLVIAAVLAFNGQQQAASEANRALTAQAEAQNAQATAVAQAEATLSAQQASAQSAAQAASTQQAAMQVTIVAQADERATLQANLDSAQAAATEAANAQATQLAEQQAAAQATNSALQDAVQQEMNANVTAQAAATEAANAQATQLAEQQATNTALQDAAQQELNANATAQAALQATIAAQSDANAQLQSSIDSMVAAVTEEAQAMSTLQAQLTASQAQVTALQGRALAAFSSEQLANNLPLGLLLGAEAINNGDSGAGLRAALDARPFAPSFLSGHDDTVYGLAYSPDGTRLVSGGMDFNAVVWDTATGHPVGSRLSGHSDSIFNMAFSPNGRYVASASPDHSVMLWNMETGEERRLLGHSDWVTKVAFSPDSTILASASYDDTITLWDVASGELRATLSGHTDDVRALAFSPDGSVLASGGADKRILLWSVVTGAFGREFSAFHADWVNDLQFSPSGKDLASVSGDGQLAIWDVRSGEPRMMVDVDSAPVTSLNYSPDGSQIVTVSSAVNVWNLGGSITLEYAVGPTGTNTLWEAVFSPDGQTVAYSDGNEVGLLPLLPQSRMTRSFEVQTAPVRTSIFSPDGTTLLTTSEDSTAIVWDVNTGEQRFIIEAGGGQGVIGSAFSPDGSFLALGGGDGGLTLWDAASGTFVRELGSFNDWVLGVAFSRDGSQVGAVSSDGQAQRWDVVSGEVLGTSTMAHDGAALWAIAYSPTADIYATAGGDSMVRIWDAGTGDLISELSAHTDQVFALAFSPDGSILASGSGDATVIFWDTETWQANDLLQGHGSSVFTIGFSPDGTQIITGGADNTAVLWDTATGEMLASPFYVAQDWVNDAAFSPDGRWLALGIGGADRVDQRGVLLPAAPQTVAALACQMAGRNLTLDEWRTYVTGEYDVTCPDYPPHYSALAALVEQAEAAAAAGDDSARALYVQVVEQVSVTHDPGLNNTVCWYGSLYGFADVVLSACERAVSLASLNGSYVDSRGLARALTGDLEGAVSDFQYYADWTQAYGFYEPYGAQRAEWVARLTAGENPFSDPALLEELFEQ